MRTARVLHSLRATAEYGQKIASCGKAVSDHAIAPEESAVTCRNCLQRQSEKDLVNYIAAREQQCDNF